MTATTAGFTLTVRGRRVYLFDVEPTRDPGMSHHEARELAQRLLCAAHAAESAARPTRPNDGDVLTPRIEGSPTDKRGSVQVEISTQAWSHPTSDAAAWARAGGRRRYNATRQARAELRRAEVVRLLGTLGLRHGTQAVIARRLGVSEATISRDVTAVFGYRPRRCRCCGCACDALADLDEKP
jgi:hypothetical protein